MTACRLVVMTAHPHTGLDLDLEPPQWQPFNLCTRHEINLVFEVSINDSEPVCQEDHLEFRWLPVDQLADADIRPSALKDALVTVGEDRTPFWCPWNG